MGNAIRLFICMLTRVVVSLRYRITVQGWDQIRNLKGPVLLVPNHPGMIDPVLILATFYGVFRPRTVLYEGNFPGPIASLLVKLLRAIPIPDLHRPSQEAYRRTERAIEEVIAGLHRGENFVLWPSGRAQRDGVERLAAARALTDILREVPDVNVVLVRTSGVWGSQFSFAATGHLPQLGRCLLNGALLLASNLVVLMPRRQVKITIELINRSELPELKREAINPWFEAKYNQAGPEQPTFVPYHFLFGGSEHQFPALTLGTEENTRSDQVSSETRQAISEILSERLGRPVNPDQLEPNTKLEDLGMDSLQRMQLALVVEQQFHVSGDFAPDTVGQLMALAEGIVEKEIRKPPPEWFSVPSREEPLRVMGETILEAFVSLAVSKPKDVAAADELSGVMTYERLLIGALLMSRRFGRLSAGNVGLMLPASVASDTMLLGLYLGNKLPVLLNWTTGPANLQHCVQLTGLKHVITSRKLLDHLGISIEGVQFLLVEDLHKEVGWLEQLCWFAIVRYLPGYLHKNMPQRKPEDQAVILFTSGSEKAPKAVPLTHKNIISNIRIVPTILNLTNRDAVLGFLPMFHSFGFTVTGLFPLLTGIRVIHHSDPTDTAGLTRKIASYRPTVLVGMPSIISHLLSRANQGELDSLKLIAVGAEACPAELYELARTAVPNALLLEGYGVTECSPLISGNRPNAIRIGTVGQPLPGVEVCIVDLDYQKKLPAETMGMLLVSGPSVFSGYLGSEESPFVEHEGKTWYSTGDLAKIDKDGFIHFCGRLKRFIKAGGEMISLPALEEPFVRRYPPDKNGPRVAVEGIESKDGRRIILFTTENLSLQDANAELSKYGFRGVMRLDEVRPLDKIPLLGTGKIDYRQLRTMIGKGTALKT